MTMRQSGDAAALGLRGAACSPCRRRRCRDHHAQPSGTQKSADLRKLRRARQYLSRRGPRQGVKAIVITGAGGNFCSGGDVFEIIKPLTEMGASGLLDFTRMTGELVKAMRAAPQPIIAAIDGVAPAPAPSSPWRPISASAPPTAKVAFLFNRVGLGGCDMGACAILPRIIGQGRAAELLFTGRSLGGEDAERWGFFNRLAAPRTCSPMRKPWRGACGRTDLRQCDDQAHVGNGMGHVGGDRDRGRGCGAGFVHGDRGFCPRLPGVRGQAQAGVRGQLNSPVVFRSAA